MESKQLENLLCGFVKHAVISISDDVFYTSVEQVLLGWIEGSFRQFARYFEWKFMLRVFHYYYVSMFNQDSDEIGGLIYHNHTCLLSRSIYNFPISFITIFRYFEKKMY